MASRAPILAGRAPHEGSPRAARAVPLPDALPAQLATLVARCPVAFRMLAAARTGTSLTPAERHVLIYMLAPLGEDGRRLIHQMLAQGSDYDPDSVARDIHAVPVHAIGCKKIRKLLKVDPERDGCNCVFKLPENAYASPLCHLGRFPVADVPVVRRRPDPVDLDGEEPVGYVPRRAKAASVLDRLDRTAGPDTGQGTGLAALLRRLLGRG
jgi:hypothetical protein